MLGHIQSEPSSVLYTPRVPVYANSIVVSYALTEDSFRAKKPKRRRLWQSLVGNGTTRALNLPTRKAVVDWALVKCDVLRAAHARYVALHQSH